MKTILALFESLGAILRNTHVVYTSGKHGNAYVNKDVIYPHTEAVYRLCFLMAKQLENAGIDVVAGPAMGGLILAQWVAFHLSQLTGREVLAVYAEKEGEGFAFRRGQDKLIVGKRVLVVEDILTTGGSVKKVNATVRADEGHLVVVFALCNRGCVTCEMIDSPLLYTLVDINLQSYEPDNCPLCHDGVPINMSVGHGKQFLLDHPELAHLAPK
ncbi:MAG: phosphoribosyltransferase [Candidatus Magasanikbacteria bacterium]|nr:phosphoribosyltransferase [Candidatus Magasanikbacteria bacterium]